MASLFAVLGRIACQEARLFAASSRLLPPTFDPRHTATPRSDPVQCPIAPRSVCDDLGLRPRRVRRHARLGNDNGTEGSPRGETPAVDSMVAASSSMTPWGNVLYGEARGPVRARLQRHAASVSAWCYVPVSSEVRD